MSVTSVEFVAQCHAAGAVCARFHGSGNLYAWLIPCKYVLVHLPEFEEGAVTIVPNEKFALSDNTRPHIGVFDSMEYALAAYVLMNGE